MEQKQYPLVSVLLPFYNADITHFRNSIESIENQDYPNLEVIISDDGDSLMGMLEGEFPEILVKKNIRVVKNPGPKGIFSNINYLLLLANGSFFQLFGQDDVMFKTFVSDQVREMLYHPQVAMVFCSFEVIDNNGVMLTSGVNYTFRQEQDLVILASEAPFMFLKFGCLPGNISPVMLRRDAVRHIGQFNHSLPFAGDFEYWIRISEKYDIYYRHKLGLQVRKHPSQASFTIPNRQLLLDLSRVYKHLLDLVPERKRKMQILRINRLVGAAFLHDTIVGMMKGRKALAELKVRFIDLRLYPFNPILSTLYYIISIPSRVYRKISYVK